MKKWCFLLFTLSMYLHSNAQTVDTIINGIQYSIFEEKNIDELTNFQCRLKNTTDKIYSFQKFGLEKNKAFFSNSQNEKTGFDFILCGSFENLSLLPDSSMIFDVSPIKRIATVSSFFGLELNENYVLDSLYQFYWRVNDNLIGPVKYYPEKDLVANLQSTNKEIRSLASSVLMNLQRNKKRLDFSNIEGDLKGKYIHRNRIKAWNGCCETMILFDLKDNYEFTYNRQDDEGCYVNSYNAKGYYGVKNDTILFVSPLDLVDSLHFFRDKQLVDSLIKITIKSPYGTRGLPDVDRYFKVYTNNINLDKKEIKWLYTSPSQTYIDSIKNEKNTELLDEISFYFNKNQLSDFLTISQKYLEYDPDVEENEEYYQLIRSTTIETHRLGRAHNHIDLRGLYTKYSLVADEDVSHCKLIIKDDYLISELKYQTYTTKNGKRRKGMFHRKFERKLE